MTTGLFGTEERQTVASFSRPIWALPDGLLVTKGNPLGLIGYQSVAERAGCVLAVIRDQFQHRSAVQFGIPKGRVRIFETYVDAAMAVRNGHVGAYASVARAHSGFIERNPDLDLELIVVPEAEKKPAFGSFAFGKSDDDFRKDVDRVLGDYLGSSDHRSMMSRYGFSDEEIDLLSSTLPIFGSEARRRGDQVQVQKTGSLAMNSRALSRGRMMPPSGAASAHRSR